jgi:hypothetical protein
MEETKEPSDIEKNNCLDDVLDYVNAHPGEIHPIILGQLIADLLSAE